MLPAEKCKATIENKTLRVGKSYDNGDRVMTSWYHPACWPVPKALVSLADIQGWDTLDDEHKQLLIDRARMTITRNESAALRKNVTTATQTEAAADPEAASAQNSLMGGDLQDTNANGRSA